LLTTETPDFIPPTLWPPNSLDLNPVDYCVSGISDVVLETKVLVSRRLEDKNTSLGLGLGLGVEIKVLILVLTKQS